MIQAIGLKKRYKEVCVLNGVDLLISKGEIVSIIGASGAGKSTLLHALSTLDVVDEGQLLFNNENLAKMNDVQLAKHRNENLGFVFQFHNLLPEFTALENILIPALIGKKDIKASTQRAKELLVKLNLDHRADHKPSQMSGGEQQRVAVARALINNPSVIFADEPSGNLDLKNATDLHQFFLDLRAETGQTFVIVTHNQDLAKISDRVIELKGGVCV